MLSKLLKNKPTIKTQSCEINLNGTLFHYTLKQSTQRRSLAMSLRSDGLCVNAPSFLGKREIEAWLRKKSSWIIEKTELQKKDKKPTDWLAQQRVNYLGQSYQLTVMSKRKAGVLLQDQVITVHHPKSEEPTYIQQTLLNWYAQQAKSHCPKRLTFWAKEMQLTPAALSFGHAKTRWGSCCSHGKIRLNIGVMQLPTELVDYIIVHELAHLKHMNHSSDFWQLVAQYKPNYKDLNQQLRSFTPQLPL